MLVVNQLGRDQSDSPPSGHQSAAACGQDVLDPVTVRAIGQGKKIAIPGREHIDRRLVATARTPASVSHNAEARHPGSNALVTRFRPTLFHRAKALGSGILVSPQRHGSSHPRTARLRRTSPQNSAHPRADSHHPPGIPPVRVRGHDAGRTTLEMATRSNCGYPFARSPDEAGRAVQAGATPFTTRGNCGRCPRVRRRISMQYPAP